MLEGNSGPLERRLEPLRPLLAHRDARLSRPVVVEAVVVRALGAQQAGRRQSLRLNLYGGPEETHLAYLGVPAQYLRGDVTGDVDRDRRFNPLTYADERDHFFEPHYELVHTWSPRADAHADADAVLVRRQGLLRRAALRPRRSPTTG